MKHFKKTLAAVVLSGFIAGTTSVLAWSVPGVDEPYNPPAYYDPFQPDPEDSPSPFMYKDMKSQGYQVHDATREAKNTEIALSYADRLATNLNNLNIAMINMKKLSAATVSNISNYISASIAELTGKNKAYGIAEEVDNGTVMRNTDRYDSSLRGYSPTEKYRLNEAAASSAADMAMAVSNDNHVNSAISENLAEQLSAAEGHNKFLQGTVLHTYLNTHNLYKRLQLKDAELAMLIQEEAAELDDSIARIRRNMIFKAEDPYENQENYGHVKEKKTPLGFIDFK